LFERIEIKLQPLSTWRSCINACFNAIAFHYYMRSVTHAHILLQMVPGNVPTVTQIDA
jgi:hypothetical protein